MNLEFIKTMNKEERYKYMVMFVDGLISSEDDIYANLSNTSAVIYAIMDKLNWSGFYIMRDGELVLGPFQGMPACTRIPCGRGVCGTAVEKKEIMRIPDVHKFPGHIACDSASNSEIVLPLIKDGVVYGVLDIDSYAFDNFGELEEKYLQEVVAILNKHLDYSLLQYK